VFRVENKNKGTTSIAIGLACVWMGTHFGPGVASGTQIIQYWVNYGVFGTICSILAMALLGYCLYCSMEFPESTRPITTVTGFRRSLE